MTDKPKVSAELSRELNLFHITMMGLGMMIGAGVFLGMGISIGQAGPGGVVLTFALNGVLAILTAMSFAELSSAIPRAGGVYNFARIAFGRQASFLAGWMEWFASSVAGAMYALTFSIYTIRYFQTLGAFDKIFLLMNIEPQSAHAENITWITVKAVAVITAIIFIYINYRGASETGKIGAIITMGQTIFVLLIGVVGVVVAIKDPSRLANFKPFMPAGWTKLLVTMGFTYVAFEGYEVIAQAGDEAINPRQNLPKAMIYSVFIVTVLYVLVAIATVVSVKIEQAPDGSQPWQWIGSFGEKGFGEAVAKLFPFGNFILTLAVIFSSTSALNATIYSATRASYALGRDKMLPKIFSLVHRIKKTPYGALSVTAIIVLLVATVLPTKDVASSASIMFLFLFFLVNLCVIRIRLNMADELIYGFLMPLFPVFPILAIILQIFLAIWLVHMSPAAWIIAPLWIFAGVAIYMFYSKSRAATTADEILILDEKPPVNGDDDRYRVMVAVANPANAVAMVQSTYKICGAKNAQIELLHMAPVPDQISLHDAEKYLTEGRESLTEAMLYLAMHFPISFTIRYCRNIARGIVFATRQKKTNMLVMGWHGKPKSRFFSIGSTIDPIVERCPCDIAVLKDCGGNKEFKNSLVLAGGGPNSTLALEVASILTERTGKITILTIDTGQGGFDQNQWLEDNKERLQPDGAPVEIKIIKAKSVVRAVLEISKDYDLLLLGTSQKPILTQIGRRSIPDIIAARVQTPVVITKAAGKLGWVKKWI